MIYHLQDLARDAIYEPSRRLEPETEPPQMVPPGIHELCIRLAPGCRTFATIDEDGNVVDLAIMAEGGSESRVRGQLRDRVAMSRMRGRLKVV